MQIGGFLDAASSAADVLAKHPSDRQAREDYNFAVARIFGVIHRAGLEPWKKPLLCPGAAKSVEFLDQSRFQARAEPVGFRHPAGRFFDFRGTLVVQRTLKEGIGAPLVVESKATDAWKNRNIRGEPHFLWHDRRGELHR